MRLTFIVPLLTMTQSACIVVGGYTSRGGWFLWPGSLGFLVLLLILYLLFGRGR